VTKHRSMEIVIQRPMSHDELAKNGILLALLNAFNAAKGGCFGAVSMAIQRALDCFGRRIGVRSKKRAIEQRLFL
jgi:hypothetical protein